MAAEDQLAVLLGTGLAPIPTADVLDDAAEINGDDSENEGGGARLAPNLGEAAMRLLEPMRLEAQFLLGVVYQRTAREELALDLLEAVADADANHWRARFQLALIATQWGMHRDAHELLAEVKALNPTHAQTAAIMKKLDQLFEAEVLDKEEDDAMLVAAAEEKVRLDEDPSLPSDEEIMAELDAIPLDEDEVTHGGAKQS